MIAGYIVENNIFDKAPVGVDTVDGNLFAKPFVITVFDRNCNLNEFAVVLR